MIKSSKVTFANLLMPFPKARFCVGSYRLTRVHSQVDALLYERESVDLSELQLCLMAKDIMYRILRTRPKILGKFNYPFISKTTIYVSYYAVAKAYYEVYKKPSNRNQTFYGLGFAYKISDDIFIKGRPEVLLKLNRTPIWATYTKGLT